MDPIDFSEAIQLVLDSITNDRLTVLAGAGLSMGPPTLLPSAPSIAKSAKEKYQSIHGPGPAIPDAVEDQAQFFFERGELSSVYFRTLVDKDMFSGPPNDGHLALADLLLTRAVLTSVTTNVDAAIEAAGAQLYGKIEVGLSGEDAAAIHPDASPLLKIHGCHIIDPSNMVWARGQLDQSPVKERIEASRAWLPTRLADRDLLIVGYWTDWDYLNEVLASSLGTVRPARVIVVDPAEPASFEAKAPGLCTIGQRATSRFVHVRAPASEFLDELRRQFSRTFVRRLLYAGRPVFGEEKGAEPDAELLEPPDSSSRDLWELRRDLEGREANAPCCTRVPENDELLALTLLQIRARGGVFEGPYWSLDGRRIRVVKAGYRQLHRAKAALSWGVSRAMSPDVVIAVGSEESALPKHIVRAEDQPNVARAGETGEWLTRRQAVEVLAL